MAHFYGVVSGCGRTGLQTVAASWQGAIKVRLYEGDGVDHALAELMPWRGAGVSRVLYDGLPMETHCRGAQPEIASQVTRENAILAAGSGQCPVKAHHHIGSKPIEAFNSLKTLVEPRGVEPLTS
jgi:hypothetical protein